MDTGGQTYLARIAALDEAAEVALLNDILTSGFDGGCFLRPDEADLVPIDPATTDTVMVALDDREHAPEPTADDSCSDVGLAPGDIAGEEPGFVILTQRCDLVRPLRTEPFVELARASLVNDAAIISAAKKNSGRYIHLVDAPGGAWVADLRRRAVLAKDRLTMYPALQVLPDEKAFKRFKLRVGQRYSRDALPTDIVERLQRPLITLLRKKPAHLKLVDIFSEFLVFRAADDKVEVLALYPDHVDRENAEDVWQQLEELMPEGVLDYLDENASGAISIRHINFWRWFSGWKLDLDEITYAGRAGPNQQPPTL